MGASPAPVSGSGDRPSFERADACEPTAHVFGPSTSHPAPGTVGSSPCPPARPTKRPSESWPAREPARPAPRLPAWLGTQVCGSRRACRHQCGLRPLKEVLAFGCHLVMLTKVGAAGLLLRMPMAVQATPKIAALRELIPRAQAMPAGPFDAVLKSALFDDGGAHLGACLVHPPIGNIVAHDGEGESWQSGGGARVPAGTRFGACRALGRLTTRSGGGDCS